MDHFRTIDDSKARIDRFRREAAEFQAVRAARQRRRRAGRTRPFRGG